MPKTAFRYLILFLIFSDYFLCAQAQEMRYPFAWNSGNSERMAGEIRVAFREQPAKNIFTAELEVTWFDKQGNRITDTGIQPWLFLSRFDLELLPENSIKCLSFEGDRRFELAFQDKGNLLFSTQEGFSGDIKIRLSFQYALSREAYLKADMQRIRTDRANSIEITRTIERTVPKTETDNRDPRATAYSQESLKLMGQIRELYQNSKSRLDQLKGRSLTEQAESRAEKVRRAPRTAASEAELNSLNTLVLNFLGDIDALLADIDKNRSLLSNERLPSDTVSAYLNRFTLLRDESSSLRNTYFRINLTLSDYPNQELVAESGIPKDSLLKTILERYQLPLKLQSDSITKMLEEHSRIAGTLNPLLKSGKRRILRSDITDSLIQAHQLLSNSLAAMRQDHNRLWTQYRADITGLELVPQIEKIHGLFIESDQKLADGISDTDELLLRNQNKISPPDGRLSDYWLAWSGLGLLLLFTVYLIFRGARSRGKNTPEIRVLENGSVSIQGNRASAGNLFEEDPSREYCTMDLLDSMPESIIGKVHYSFASIRTIYQLIHGAFLDKKPGDFGGYLFGSQYKISSNGNTRFEIVIEKAVSSKCLRADIQNDISARADLVDEMDELVRQNKKYLLLGWFTSASDSSLEMQEGLMKIHRTFFKEKWQIGLSTSAGTEDLTSAMFLRRKSGYFDPYPDPASFIRLEELYRYSLNPVPSGSTATEPATRDLKEYASIAFNSTWTDTWVQEIFFRHEVVAEIKSASQMVSNPAEGYQTVGYLYGFVERPESSDGPSAGGKVYIDRFVELSNELTPRVLPGFSLIGWWAQSKAEVFTYLNSAIGYHEQICPEPYQIACFLQSETLELRIFTRKSNLGMNNSIMETEEFNLNQLV